MHHVYWVFKDDQYPGKKLGGRCGPSRAPWDPTELYEGGIRTVITVASEVHVGDLESYGLLHHRVRFPPLPFMLPPSQKAFVQRTTPVLKFIHQQLEAQRPTLVHCHDGDDRTGIILAAYLVVYQGLSPQAAVRHVRTVNPSAMKMPGYAATVRRFVTLTDRGTQDKGLVIPNVCEESQRSG